MNFSNLESKSQLKLKERILDYLLRFQWKNLVNQCKSFEIITSQSPSIKAEPLKNADVASESMPKIKMEVTSDSENELEPYDNQHYGNTSLQGLQTRSRISTTISAKILHNESIDENDSDMLMINDSNPSPASQNLIFGIDVMQLLDIDPWLGMFDAGCCAYTAAIFELASNLRFSILSASNLLFNFNKAAAIWKEVISMLISSELMPSHLQKITGILGEVHLCLTHLPGSAISVFTFSYDFKDFDHC
jgi:hypothetical protein